MIKRIGIAGLIVVSALSTLACAPVSRFEWGSYEQALYAYAQNPENRAVYVGSLEKAIENGRARNAIAPGLLAELAYIRLEDGNRQEALKLFEEERALFPESAPFMDRIIQQTRTTAGAQ